MVFQNYSLLPWLTVTENIALAVDQVFPEWQPGERAAHVRRYIEMVRLTPAAQKRPSELSGGMRQRVSLARALACEPAILLMDEPFGALDEITRDRLNDELLKLWRRTRTTILFVTHSIMEAAYLGQRVMVLAANPGRIQAVQDMRGFRSADGTVGREEPQLVEAMASLRRELEKC